MYFSNGLHIFAPVIKSGKKSKISHNWANQENFGASSHGPKIHSSPLFPSEFNFFPPYLHPDLISYPKMPAQAFPSSQPRINKTALNTISPLQNETVPKVESRKPPHYHCPRSTKCTGHASHHSPHPRARINGNQSSAVENVRQRPTGCPVVWEDADAVVRRCRYRTTGRGGRRRRGVVRSSGTWQSDGFDSVVEKISSWFWGVRAAK